MVRRDRGDHTPPGHRPRRSGDDRRRRRRGALRVGIARRLGCPQRRSSPTVAAALSATGALLSDLAVGVGGDERRRRPTTSTRPGHARSRRRCADEPRPSSRRPGGVPSRPRSASRSKLATRTRSGRSRFRCATAHSPRTADGRRTSPAHFHEAHERTVRVRDDDVAGRDRHLARPCALPHSATTTSERARATASRHSALDARQAYFPRTSAVVDATVRSARVARRRRPASTGPRIIESPMTTVVIDAPTRRATAHDCRPGRSSIDPLSDGRQVVHRHGLGRTRARSAPRTTASRASCAR